MSLHGKKIGILIEGDYYEPEIWYYKHRFAEEEVDLHFLTRMWGLTSEAITPGFKGHEYRIPFEGYVESFENMDDETLKSYAAIIVPSAFVSDRLGSPQIFVMNSDGSNVRRLTQSGAYNVTPSWSPKGDRILYSRQQGGGFQIYSISPDGSGDSQLTTGGRNENPRWSPDGRFITFSSNRDGKDSIYVMRADGTAQTKVSRSSGGDSQPVWSPRL